MPDPTAATPVASVPVVTMGAVLDASQIASLWNAEGGPVSQDTNAVCIAEHESGGRTDVLSPTDDEGLFQINIVNAPTVAMENPQANTREAVVLFDRDGWSPWTTATGCGV
jgi:hypothetical protein